MASASNGPGKRGDDPGRNAGKDVGKDKPDAGPADATAESGRDGLHGTDDAGLRPTGRDDDLDGDQEVPAGVRDPEGGGSRSTLGGAEIEDRTVPSLEGSAIGPDRTASGGLHADDHEEHHGRSGFAASALKILIFVLVILGLSLWLVPMVAPHLPAGLARTLMPGQAELDQRLAALAEQIEQSTGQISADVSAMRGDISALTERLSAVEQTASGARTDAEAARTAAEESAASAQQNVVGGDTVSRAEAAAREASGLAETATTAATEAGKVASAASRDAASLARRMTEFDSRLAALSDQIGAVNESLTAGAAEGEAATPELAAAVASLKAEVDAITQQLGDQADLVTESEAQRFATQDDLRSARTALETQIEEAIGKLPPADRIVVADQLEELRRSLDDSVAGVAGRVDTLEADMSRATETATAAERSASEAVGKVDGAIRDASLRSAAAALISRLENGLPYAGALSEAAALQDSPPPPALAEPAETGVATRSALLDRFGPAARDAMQADLTARAGDGLMARAGARLRSVVAGRPASEQPGETVDAVLSRMEARLREGDAAAALAEAEALPEAAKAALGAWLDDLRARVAAADAAQSWLGAAAAGAPTGGATTGSTTGTTTGAAPANASPTRTADTADKGAATGGAAAAAAGETTTGAATGTGAADASATTGTAATSEPPGAPATHRTGG